MGEQIKNTFNGLVLNEGSPCDKNIPHRPHLSLVRT